MGQMATTEVDFNPKSPPPIIALIAFAEALGSRPIRVLSICSNPGRSYIGASVDLSLRVRPARGYNLDMVHARSTSLRADRIQPRARVTQRTGGRDLDDGGWRHTQNARDCRGDSLYGSHGGERNP